MKLGIKVGLGPGHVVLDGTQLPPEKDVEPPNFRPMYFGQTAGWMKMPLGTEV